MRTAISSRLTTISGLGMTDNKYHHNFTGFPAVMFEPSSDPNTFYTHNENEHIYTFDLFVVQEMESTSTGRAEAIRLLGIAVDAVTDSFDSYQTLGGVCDFTEAIPAEWGTATIGDGMVMFAHLTLKCHKLKTVT